MKELNLKEVQQVSGAAFDFAFNLDLSGTGVNDTAAVQAALADFMDDPDVGALVNALLATKEIESHNTYWSLSNFT